MSLMLCTHAHIWTSYFVELPTPSLSNTRSHVRSLSIEPGPYLTLCTLPPTAFSLKRPHPCLAPSCPRAFASNRGPLPARSPPPRCLWTCVSRHALQSTKIDLQCARLSPRRQSCYDAFRIYHVLVLCSSSRGQPTGYRNSP